MILYKISKFTEFWYFKIYSHFFFFEPLCVLGYKLDIHRSNECRGYEIDPWSSVLEESERHIER